MKRTILSLVCGALIGTGAIPATGLSAERSPKTPVVNQRQQNQRERIQQGVKSGELTRREAARLREQEARIRAAERRAKRDGEVTAAERARLERELRRASENIRKQKHDKQDRN
jgi:hypothetical protein